MPRISKQQKEETKALAESSLLAFAKLTNPTRLYGSVHEELFRWWTRPDGLENQLLLLPRDHQKSHCLAVRVAWEVTRNPDITVLYVSATADLAEKQLYAIKNILTSPVYRRYWPEMVNEEEGKRELWNVSEIAVDHPKRKAEGVRDPTIKAAGLTTNITGFHANIAALDDVVVPKNAYTEEGRNSVKNMYSQLASIETTGAREWVVGTRYHPDDLYQELKDMVEEIYDDHGNPVGEQEVYEVFERVVEEDGVFLWPKSARPDGKHFGFDEAELARKKAKYIDKTQFYAQYYNDPNDPENHRLSFGDFQYFDPTYLEFEGGVWYFNDRRLSLFAAADLAWSDTNRSDYTAVAVIGVDEDGYIYVLDLARFKTTKYEEYYEKIIAMYFRWQFKKLLVETNGGGLLVAEYLKDKIRKEGGSLVIEGRNAPRRMGSKEERIAEIVEPRYENNTIWHYKGGLTNILEEELILANPKHDDLKDALAAAIMISKPPGKLNRSIKEKVPMIFHSRFGGVAR